MNNLPGDTISSLVIPIDSRGLVLLQQKTYDAPNFPGVWSCFGGKKEVSETAVEAACQEVKEELNLGLPTSDFTHFKTFHFPEQKKVREVFLLSVTDNMKLTLCEGRGMGYFNEQEIKFLEMPEHIRLILSEYFLVQQKKSRSL